MEIEYDFKGFVRDAAYRIPIQEVVKEFEQQFPGASKLIVNVHEIPYHALGQPRREGIVISPDKSEVTVTVNVQKYYNNKGQVTSSPDPFDVCTSVRTQLKRASDKFNNQ